MLSTEANFVKISAIFFSLACVAEVILPRLLDFKTVRIFAYSSKREQSNKKVWNEAENGEWDWGETLRRFFFLSPHTPYGHVRLARFALKTLTSRFTDFFTDFVIVLQSSRLYKKVCEAASRSLLWTTYGLNELPEVRLEFPFILIDQSTMTLLGRPEQGFLGNVVLLFLKY